MEMYSLHFLNFLPVLQASWNIVFHTLWFSLVLPCVKSLQVCTYIVLATVYPLPYPAQFTIISAGPSKSYIEGCELDWFIFISVVLSFNHI